MDEQRARLDALERHIQAVHQHTHTVERQLRWWRGLAGGLVALALLTWELPSGTAQDATHGDKKGWSSAWRP
jgi:hypothetical protein